jgi:hypothetical protein
VEEKFKKNHLIESKVKKVKPKLTGEEKIKAKKAAKLKEYLGYDCGEENSGIVVWYYNKKGELVNDTDDRGRASKANNK